MNRDDFTRCRICKRLFSDAEAVLDPIKGFQCPNGCQPTFNQPNYESPLVSEEVINTEKSFIM
jgi:hypothetical protein